MLLGVRYRLEYKLEADNKSPVARVEEVKGLNGAEERRRGAWGGKGEREQRYFTGFACGRTLIIFVPSGMAGLILSRSAVNEALQGRQDVTRVERAAERERSGTRKGEDRIDGLAGGWRGQGRHRMRRVIK